ncbi:pectate lyase, partial [bacterium]|nr:pectate lyase [bacterium]
PKMKPHVTRFVPGREGLGLTDRIDSVISTMKNKDIAVLDHNYGLWTDRRRDDHQRIRRRDGDVWAPFYEQPFARSGQGTAWDGLSKYDLNRPNEWYWMRLQEFANKAERSGKMLFHENFFQHNIIEAGAHWVDCPWRTANNINDIGFPEPVNFAGDKRVFMTDIFYDLSNENRKNAYRNYIRQSLNVFANSKNVVQLLSSEYTGPLHFMQFWLDVIDEWQRETGNNALVALSCTKDVQDAILADAKRAALVDIIDIRYWHYKTDGLYAPQGGLNLAPRQHARLQKVGKVSVAQMEIAMVKSDTYKILEKSGFGAVIYTNLSTQIIPLNTASGSYCLKFIDPKTGTIETLRKTIKVGKQFDLKPIKGKEGIYWLQKI